MERRTWGIGGKFIFFISFSVVVFMAATFAISQDVLRKYALKTADELATTILDQTDKRIGEFFREMEYLAKGLAATQVVRSVDADGMRDLFVSTVAARTRYLRAIYLGTVDGRMFEWGEGRGFVDHAPSFPAGYDPRVRPWYLDAVAKDAFSISPPYRFASVDDLGITCVIPVRAADGAFVGVLGLDILLDDLKSILEDLRIPQEGKALILSPDGDIVASQFPQDRAAGFVMKRFAVPGGEGIFDDASGSFSGEVDGRNFHFVHRKAENFDWIIAVAMPLGSIMASMRSLLSFITASEIFLMTMLIVAIAAITGRLIISPLTHIVSVINKIEGGRKDARVTVRSKDEFGLLGREFNKLVDAVAEYSRDLEDKVARRTGEIWRLQRENTQLRILEERQRIYRDMHDSIGAKLTNIFFSNGVARDLSKDGPEKLRELLGRIEANCLQAIRKLKEIILGMRRDDLIASDAAKILSAGIRQRLQTKDIAFDCRMQNREVFNALDPEARGEVEKVFEELVSNVLKHSGASRVRLRLRAGTEGLSIRFSDDGRGFEPRSAPGTVSGLDNIKYRIERLGGTLRSESGAGRGTAFAISIPAPPQEAMHAG
ncbi:MAG: cache domain-containing protein [Spirochaetes bacterium]|nr:cache domain-containing protein [Spirochaetota bacterium]